MVRTGKRFAAIAGVAAAALVGLVVWMEREPLRAWHRHLTVKKLLVPERRDDVLRTILSWQRYRGEPYYKVTDKDLKPIAEVAVSVQQDGHPIYVVFFRDSWRGPGDKEHHVETFDFDGTIVPWHGGANVEQPENVKDINGDRILEAVQQIGCSTRRHNVTQLWVLPITREMRPSLSLLYNRDDPKESWSWELTESETRGVRDLTLGVRDPSTGKISPRAVYRWSAPDRCFVGPPGGLAEPFLRIDGMTDGIEEECAMIERFANGADPPMAPGR